MGRKRLQLWVGLAFVWVAATVIFAFSIANGTMRQLVDGSLPLTDTVTLNDQRHLFGKVIRIVDKGVFVARGGK